MTVFAFYICNKKGLITYTIYIGVIVSIINPSKFGQNKRPNRLSLSGLLSVTLFSFDGQEPTAISLHILFFLLQYQESFHIILFEYT
jgi:hypothetical protein